MRIIEAPTPEMKPGLSDRDHVMGDEAAPVTLVEYGDFECPHCSRAFAVVKELQSRLGRGLRFAYRHFPLAKLHKHARGAAEASEAAAAQGQFWEMHDRLFEHARELEPDQLVEHARAIGLDAERVRADLAAHVHAARVQEDLSSGVRSGVNGTPTFYLNGKRFNGSYEMESLLPAIEAALAGA